jgi:hypothetical protein
MSIKKSILEGTGDIIAEIKFHRILHDPACSVTHQDLSLLTSYDLLPKENKTIIVPGMPWKTI